MNPSIIAVLLGLVVGASFAGALALFFVLSRPYRRVRKWWSLLLGYVLIPVLGISSVLLLGRACDYFHIELSPARDYALYAFTATLLIGMLTTLVSEFRWRKEIGLDGRNVRIGAPKRVGASIVIVLIFCSFQAGIGTVLLLGTKPFVRISFGLALFSTVCAIIGAFLCGFILSKLTRKQQNE